MKKVIIIAAIAMMALAAASCQKEEASAVFTASMEQPNSGKLYIDGLTLKWKDRDAIRVYSLTNLYTGSPYIATVNSSDPTWATFSPWMAAGEITRAPFRAFYPGNTVLNGERFYHDISKMSMVAESETHEFQFHNLCGVLRVNLPQTIGVSISSIRVNADRAIQGQFAFDGNVESPSISPLSGLTSNDATISLATPLDLGSSGDHYCYIYLPPATYSTLTLTFTSTQGHTYTKSASNVTVARNTLHPVTIGGALSYRVQGDLGGLFSVSPTKQVHFSKGNLQYQASTSTWRFAEHQYDFVGTHLNSPSSGNAGNVSGSDNASIGPNYSGWIDLFSWGTSGYHNSADSYNVNYMPYNYAPDNVNTTYNYYGYGPSTNMTDPDLTGTSANYDWGVYNAISNGGSQAGLWRTLTKDEWNYLVDTRDGASRKYGATKIIMGDGTYVRGYIIVPDIWTCPEGITLNLRWSNTNDYGLNLINIAQWNQLEASGAVFLPAAGLRMQTIANGPVTLQDIGTPMGNYWMSTHYDCKEAYRVHFNSSSGLLQLDELNGKDRFQGLSVRLVHEN